MVILVDIDGVCANLSQRWVQWYNDKYHDVLTPADFTSWRMEDHVKPACGSSVYDFLRIPGIYRQVQPIEGAREGVEALRLAGHRVVFVTSTPLEQQGEKLIWLSSHGFLRTNRGFSKDYIEASDKSLVSGAVLIDDAVHNLETSPCPLKVLFNAPHNLSDYSQQYRMMDWSQWQAVIIWAAKLGVE